MGLGVLRSLVGTQRGRLLWLCHFLLFHSLCISLPGNRVYRYCTTKLSGNQVLNSNRIFSGTAQSKDKNIFSRSPVRGAFCS